MKINIIILLFLISLSTTAQSDVGLKIKSLENGKIKTVNSGQIIGVLTKSDTLISQMVGYFSSTKCKDSSLYEEIWVISDIDTANLKLTITKKCQEEKFFTFNFSDIQYLYIRKENDSNYKEGVAYLALFSLLGGTALIAQAESRNDYIWSSILLTVGVGSASYLYFTRNWNKEKKYVIVK